MGRLRRFDDHRFVGVRDTMRVYDCDDPTELALLTERVEAEDLVGRNGLQSFAPDTVEEAANRGFKPVEV